MTIKKLIVKEFEVDKCDVSEKIGKWWEVGEKYSYFVDPETGKHYRPRETFEVTGDDLEQLFVEVK